uniref:Uncharacterized protein n=1 Tax=Rhizophora mucronata TaxID=61149 RepID=A0A2P2NY59_RHIMU
MQYKLMEGSDLFSLVFHSYCSGVKI